MHRGQKKPSRLVQISQQDSLKQQKLSWTCFSAKCSSICAQLGSKTLPLPQQTRAEGCETQTAVTCLPPSQKQE